MYPSRPKPAIVQHLKAIRKTRKQLQADVALRAGISREALLRAENGSADPRLSTLVQWAASLGYELTLTPIQGQTNATTLNKDPGQQTIRQSEGADAAANAQPQKAVDADSGTGF